MKLFLKRFLLIITGIILSLFVLECGLRFAGWTISSCQQYKNNKTLKKKSQYTIMCLGESTTASQYPIQLQQILNNKYPNKFSVIDCGIPRIDLGNILDLLNTNINKYHPDIAICMMGINNGITEFYQNNDIENIRYIKNSKKITLKVYKLYLLMKRHLINSLNKQILADVNTSQDIHKCAIELKLKGKIKEAEILLKDILRNNTNDEIAFYELTMLYVTHLRKEKEDIIYDMLVKAIDENLSYNKQDYYEFIFDHLKHKRDFDKLKYYIDKAINEDIDIFSSIEKATIYRQIKSLLTPQQHSKILKTMIKNDDFGIMAIEAIDKKNYQKAQEYFDKAEEIRLKLPNIQTYSLYKQIVKELIDNNIKVICMQYPVRSIKPLQEQLKNEPYYDKITFISNEQLFKNTLMKKSYNDLFIDQFAGDFGHCTKLGNTIIAKNVVNTLEKILYLKQN